MPLYCVNSNGNQKTFKHGNSSGLLQEILKENYFLENVYKMLWEYFDET